MSRVTGRRARFDLLLILLSFLVEISPLFLGGGVGQALGRKSSPGSVGRKFGGVGAVISSGGALFLLLPEALAGFGSAFGSLWMMNPYLSCHLESSLSFLTLWKLGLKLR